MRAGIVKCQLSRAGAPNYVYGDVAALVEFVAEEEPLGASHWAVVAHKSVRVARDNGRPSREQETLKNIIDYLANTKKAGYPSCPANVRRKKHIMRETQTKRPVVTLDKGSAEEVDDGVGERVSMEREVTAKSSLGKGV